MPGKGQVAVVTGGGTGVGRAAALHLQADGWDVVIAGRRREPLDSTVAMASASGGRMVAVAADVTHEPDVERLFQETIKAFGRVDFLFNNAGRGAPAVPTDELALATWQEVVDVNLTGVFLCAREAMRYFKKQKPPGGRIVNNGSLSAHVPRPDSVAYTSTKHAVTGLTRSIALDGRRFNIACGQIDIGNADTEMAARAKSGAMQPNGECVAEPVMDPDHCGSAVLYMASLPLDANMLTMTIKATAMPFEGRG